MHMHHRKRTRATFFQLRKVVILSVWQKVIEKVLNCETGF